MSYRKRNRGKKYLRNVVFTFPVRSLFQCMKLPPRWTAATASLLRGGGVIMRLGAFATAICLSIIGISTAQNAEAVMRRPTHIAAQGLAHALQIIAKERNVQVVYRSELVRDQRTSGAAGDLTFDEAMTQLLSGTGLTFRYLDDRAITITLIGAPTGSAAATSSPMSEQAGSADSAVSPHAKAGGEGGGDSRDAVKKSLWDRFRLAQVDQGVPAGSPAATRRDEQTSGRKPIQLEEVIVTAQKREERLIDVPISIVVLTADDLEKRNVTGIDDLSLAVPGLSVVSEGGAFRTIVLRGVSNSSGSNSSLIGLYIDEASVTSSVAYIQPDLRAYDLERVEVLRGPQGTLYGEGSVGGTIRLITMNPQLERFTTKVDVAALFTQNGTPGQRVDAVVNVPVIENELGLRVAGTYDHEGGWIDQPGANRRDINDEHLANVRIKGLWQPVQQFTASVMAIVHRDDAPLGAGEDAKGNYTQAFALTTTPSVKDDYDLYNLVLTNEFSTIRILSTSSYVDQDKKIKDEGKTLPLLPPGAPPFFNEYVPLYALRGNVFTQELRLTSNQSRRWLWTFGGFYRYGRSLIDIPRLYEGLPGVPGTPLPPPLSVISGTSSRSWAFFGDTSYQLTDRLTVGTGLRYFHDAQEFATGFAFGAPATVGPTQAATFHAVSPRIYAEYKLSDSINSYGSATKGFRSGGFNSFNQPPYGPESVWTYELGTKMSLVGGRLSTDSAIFYSNYTDYQAFGLAPGGLSSTYSNVGRARIKGVESTVRWRPLGQWDLSASGSYIDAYLAEINATATSYSVGDRLDNVPKYQYTVSGQRNCVWSGKSGFARLDYNSQGRSTYRNRSVGPWFFSESDVIHMLNLTAGLEWNKGLSLSVFAENLLNDRGFLGPDVIEQGAARSRPRTYGIVASARFN
jgi:iron complex outermembrane receptor protein